MYICMPLLLSFIFLPLGKKEVTHSRFFTPLLFEATYCKVEHNLLLWWEEFGNQSLFVTATSTSTWWAKTKLKMYYILIWTSEGSVEDKSWKYNEVLTMQFGWCSGQNLAILQDHDTYPSHLECHKCTTNSIYQLAHSQPRGETLGSCPDLTFNSEERASGFIPSSHWTPKRGPRALSRAHIRSRGEDLKPFLSPTSATTRSLSDLRDIGSPQRFSLLLDIAQQ